MLHLVIAVIAGAVAGNLPSRLSSRLDIGWYGNSITGALGGLIGQRLIGAGWLDLDAGNLASLTAAVLTGAAGGGVLSGLAGLVRNRGGI